MYKWPQGRVIRTISLCVTLLIVADIAYMGAYGRLHVPDITRSQLILGCVYAVLGLAALIAGVVCVGFRHDSVDFLIEVESEMTKVEWPSLETLIRSTLIIAVAITIMAFLIYVVDYINIHLIWIWWPAFYDMIAGLVSH